MIFHQKSDNIARLKKALEEADAVVIGAGAGLSISAGFTYSGETMAPGQIAARSSCIDGDIGEVLMKLKRVDDLRD